MAVRMTCYTDGLTTLNDSISITDQVKVKVSPIYDPYVGGGVPVLQRTLVLSHRLF